VIYSVFLSSVSLYETSCIREFKDRFIPSFRRKPESRKRKHFWTPVFTGVTAFMAFYEVVRLHGEVSCSIKPAAPAASG
jgi:hypothetical protein